METETISSRNVVDLVLNDEFGSSICGQTISASSEEQQTTETSSPDTKDFVFGWDC